MTLTSMKNALVGASVSNFKVIIFHGKDLQDTDIARFIALSTAEFTLDLRELSYPPWFAKNIVSSKESTAGMYVCLLVTFVYL